MAFVTNVDDDDPTILSEESDSTMPKSFMTMHVTDPFTTAIEGVSEYPNAKRNILDDLNNAEATMLPPPPPPQKENLAVFLRVKPKTQTESEIANGFNVGTSETVKIVSDYQVCLTAPQDSNTFKNSIKGGKGKLIQSYSFTKILKPELSQKDLFSSLVCPMVQDFMEGQNQLLFTYGATSAGKTFTMQGEHANSGIIPRSLDTVFNTIGTKISETVPVQPIGFNRVVSLNNNELDQIRRDKESVFKLGLDLNKKSGRASPDSSMLSGCSAASTGSSVCSSVATGGLDLANLQLLFPSLMSRDKESTKLQVKDERITYSVWVSFCEIYQDNCYDLLKKVPESKKRGERTCLKLCEERDGLPYVKNLREIQVSSADEAFQIMMIGRDNLHFAATKLNQHSSRSHCIFSIKIVRVADPDAPHLARVSIFSFCDLAGSERISKTNNVGERQKETGNINTSLLILGRCIKAMRHNQNCKDKKGLEIVPFRESKLTRLFKSYLTGQGKSSLIICISQAEYLFDETIHVCKFAHLASKVTIQPVKEAPPKPAPRKSTSRFSSLVDREKNKLLSLAANASVLGRSSIAWEMPPKKSSILPGTFKPNARSTMAPGSLLPPRRTSFADISEICTGGDETINETEGTMMDNTVVQTEYEVLLNLVESLKSKLKEERTKNLNLEKNIREELCNEFNQMMVDVEQGYEKRIQAEREEAERANEWRIQELNKVHSKRNKRKREEEDNINEDELVVVRLESKLSEMTKEKEVMARELEDCQQQFEVMKETVVKSKQEQDKLQSANSKVQFELAEQQRLAAELGRELASAQKDLEEERKMMVSVKDGKSDALLESERMLSETRKRLASMEEEVSDFKDLLQEAGNEFIMKEEELQQAQNEVKEREDQINEQGVIIQDLQSQLEESHLLLQEVNNKLEETEEQLDTMEVERDKVVKDATEAREENDKQVAELKGELYFAKMKVSSNDELSTELKQRLEEAKKAAEDERKASKEAEEKLLEAQQERNQLLSVKSKLLQEIVELKTSRDSNASLANEESEASSELKAKVENLTGLNKVLTESNDGLKKEQDENFKEIQSLKLKIEELKTATNVDESLFEDEEDLKERIESLLTEKSDLRESLSSVKSEMESIKAERTRLLSQLERQEVKDFTEMETLIEKNGRLEEELRRANSRKEEEIKKLSSEVEDNLVKIKSAEENLAKLQELLDEKDAFVMNLKDEMTKNEEIFRRQMDDNVDNIEKQKKEIEANLTEEIFKKDEKIATLVQEIKDNKSLKYSNDQKSSMKVSDLESRNGSLEKEVATKDTYIKELEDIIVEKEYKISDIEKQIDVNQEKMAASEKCKKDLMDEVKKVGNESKAAYEEIERLKIKISENDEKIAHQEKMKKQRESLEKRIKDCELTSESLAKVEDELTASKDERKELESKLKISEGLVTKLQQEVEESKGEIKALKKATKNSAKEALEASEIKSKNDELDKELSRLKSIVEANNREQNALDVLKSELKSKSTELGQLQEKIQQLGTQLGGKDKELSQLQLEMDRISAENEAKEYDLNKIKDERTNLMEHYEKIFKQKQAEIDSFKAMDKEKGSLGEIMAKATPSKSLGQIKEKLSKAEDELSQVREKLAKEEDQVSELKSELKVLQKEFDSKVSQHQREMNRTKLANEKIIAEYKETNKQLQKQVEAGPSVQISPPSPVDKSNTLEADDSKTDNSLIESTPIAKKKGGRGRGRVNRTTRSMASLASFEDSNTENEPEAGRPRVASVSRKARVTRKSSKSVSVLADLDTTENANNRSTSRKRAVSSRTEASILRESLVSQLSPVPEQSHVSHVSDGHVSSVAATPVQKKKRKLYKQTPQLSEVFTPPTDLDPDTPGEIVKKQLRSRRTATKR